MGFLSWDLVDMLTSRYRTPGPSRMSRLCSALIKTFWELLELCLLSHILNFRKGDDEEENGERYCPRNSHFLCERRRLYM